MTILNISAAPSGVNHGYRVFGIGDDNKLYMWRSGRRVIAEGIS